MKLRFSLAALAFAAAVSTNAYAERRVIAPPPSLSLNAVPICYDFGCRQRSTIQVSANEWRSVVGWFEPAARTAAEEREQIQKAVGWMETIVGRHTPTHRDVAFNLPATADYQDMFPGQLDCIDEASNTTAYLRLFELNGLLRHHTVVSAAFRRSLTLAQHYSAQIRDNSSGEQFMVDTWFLPNGFLPFVQEAELWHRFTPMGGAPEDAPLWRRLLARAGE